MPTSNPEPNPFRPVVDLLADYLLHSPAVSLPGADGVLVEDALACYAGLAARGQVPAEDELCRRHPDLASRLVAYFHPNPPLRAG